MDIKFEVVKKSIVEVVKPTLADGTKVIITAFEYGAIVGLASAGYKAGKAAIKAAISGVDKALKNLKAKKAKQPETTTTEQPKMDNPEQTQEQG